MNIEKNESNKTIIAFDATMIDTFILCPQKFHLRHRLSRVPPEIAKPLDRGQLIHTGMEAYYKALKAKPDWEFAIDDLMRSYDLACLESSLSNEDLIAIRQRMLESCNVHRASDMKFEILAVEESFAYELYEDDLMKIIMLGKIDLLVNFEDYKSLPIDHKSYERDSPVHRKTNQFCNYANAVNSNYLLVNRIGMQTSIPPEKKHKRVMLAYDPTFLAQWKANVVRWCQFYLECEAENSFPLNDTSCDKYNRLCEYYQICDSSGVEAKSFKLEMHYNVAPKWDPSQSLKS